jgi:hypothetical protein
MQTAIRFPPSCTEGQVHAHCMSGEERVGSKSCLSVELTSGSCLFLQRDPFGYEDSVNLYAGMKRETVNMRDPTGSCVWEETSEEEDACWNRAEQYGVSNARERYRPLISALIKQRPSRLSGKDADEVAPTLFILYSMRKGVTVTDPVKKG